VQKQQPEDTFIYEYKYNDVLTIMTLRCQSNLCLAVEQLNDHRCADADASASFSHVHGRMWDATLTCSCRCGRPDTNVSF